MEESSKDLAAGSVKNEKRKKKKKEKESDKKGEKIDLLQDVQREALGEVVRSQESIESDVKANKLEKKKEGKAVREEKRIERLRKAEEKKKGREEEENNDLQTLCETQNMHKVIKLPVTSACSTD